MAMLRQLAGTANQEETLYGRKSVIGNPSKYRGLDGEEQKAG